jgi:hypothetical protein
MFIIASLIKPTTTTLATAWLEPDLWEKAFALFFKRNESYSVTFTIPMINVISKKTILPAPGRVVADAALGKV